MNGRDRLSDVRSDEPAARVLVVDDHQVNRMLQVRQVELLGYSAESAGDGVSALEKLRAESFDVVLTDCEMPAMDGFELARAIRAAETPGRDVPIVACTAHALPEVGARCLAAGMNFVLTKPVRLRELARTLVALCPTPAAEAAEIDVVLDEAVLALLYDGDPEGRQELLESFLGDTRMALEKLAAGLEADCIDSCRKLAHRQKGACALYGAPALGTAWAGLERLLQQRAERERLDPLVANLESECHRFEERLTADA